MPRCEASLQLPWGGCPSTAGRSAAAVLLRQTCTVRGAWVQDPRQTFTRHARAAVLHSRGSFTGLCRQCADASLPAVLGPDTLHLLCMQTAAISFVLCFVLTSFVVLNLIIPVVLEQFELRDSHKRSLQRREVLSALAHKQVR